MAHHGSCNISPHKQYDELSIRIILILSEKKYTCFRRYKCEHMMLMHVTEWWKTAATSFWHIPTKRISISRLLSIVSGNLKCTLSNTMNIMNSSSFASPAKLIRCATLVFRFGIGKRMNFNKKKNIWQKLMQYHNIPRAHRLQLKWNENLAFAFFLHD